MLIVLDNAHNEEQVRPLLPGSPGCLVLVTSRNRLAGLIAAEGARAVRLQLPSMEDARQLLRQRLGTHRVEAEPGAVDEIIGSCARLPLALALAAAHPAADPTFSLATLAGQLRDAAAGLVVGTVYHLNDRLYPERVEDQSPATGTHVAPGSTVTFTVSTYTGGGEPV